MQNKKIIAWMLTCACVLLSTSFASGDQPDPSTNDSETLIETVSGADVSLIDEKYVKIRFGNTVAFPKR